MHTLLRYPGGKSRAVKILREFIPNEEKTICSPFFGGGSLEIALAKEGFDVRGYDSFEPLVNFWQQAIQEPATLATIIEELHPMSKETFYDLQKSGFDVENNQLKAAIFYAINRSSFSGSTLSGGMSPGHPRFNQSSIERVRNFKAQNISVGLSDFKDSIANNEDAFLYCDPPYLIKSELYGNKGDTHRGFDHVGLADVLKKRDRWVLSYNNCDDVKALYKGYEFFYPSWSYGMSSDKTSKEIVIVNY